MTILNAIQKDYPTINKAAGEFLHELSGNNITKDIVLAAEMAGLMLLRASKVDLSQLSPGNVILGAVPDETYTLFQQFLVGWALSNGLDPKGTNEAKIPDDAKEYLQVIAFIEFPFCSICQQNNIKPEYYPFVATSSALKLVLAGEKLKLLDAKTGLAMTMYHIIAGSKTVPLSRDADKSNLLTPDSPYVRVFVCKSGVVTLDGKVISLDGLKDALVTLAQKKGIVLYSRESPEEPEPPAIAQTVLDLIIENRLPVKMCVESDFSDAVKPDGRLRLV